MTRRDDHVRVDDHDGVRTIQLNRPDKANALTAHMLERMAHAVRTAQAENMQVIVLRSASDVLFCAGSDIREFSEGPEHLERQGAGLRELMFEMARCPVPIIAIARGTASGAGLMVLAMTDVLIAADDLALACPELHFHMYPVIVQVVLEAKLPRALARRMCFNTQPITAALAFDHGWVTDLVQAADFEVSSKERLSYYLARRDALRIARKGKLLMELPERFIERVQMLEPLMHENFSLPGVQERIGGYLARLAAKE